MQREFSLLPSYSSRWELSIEGTLRRSCKDSTWARQLLFVHRRQIIANSVRTNRRNKNWYGLLTHAYDAAMILLLLLVCLLRFHLFSSRSQSFFVVDDVWRLIVVRCISARAKFPTNKCKHHDSGSFGNSMIVVAALGRRVMKNCCCLKMWQWTAWSGWGNVNISPKHFFL